MTGGVMRIRAFALTVMVCAAATSAADTELTIDSRLGRLLDATLTVSPDIGEARLAGKSAYKKKGLEPPPFLKNLLVERLAGAQDVQILISSLEPVHAPEFKLLLLLDGEVRVLDIILKKPSLPKLLPKEEPEITPGEVLQWMVAHLATAHGIERAAVFLELRRLAMGSAYLAGEERLMLRFPIAQWPPHILRGLRSIATEVGADFDAKSTRLANEREVLRHLLNRGTDALVDGNNLLATVNHMEKLEERLAGLNRDLEQRNGRQEYTGNIWWLEHRLWWFIAGGFFVMATVMWMLRTVAARHA